MYLWMIRIYFTELLIKTMAGIFVSILANSCWQQLVTPTTNLEVWALRISLA